MDLKSKVKDYYKAQVQCTPDRRRQARSVMREKHEGPPMLMDGSTVDLSTKYTGFSKRKTSVDVASNFSVFGNSFYQSKYLDVTHPLSKTHKWYTSQKLTSKEPSAATTPASHSRRMLDLFDSHHGSKPSAKFPNFELRKTLGHRH